MLHKLFSKRKLVNNIGLLLDGVLVDESREHFEVEDEHEEVAAVREVFEDEGLDALI